MRKSIVGQEIELTIDALGFEGISVGRIDGHVHFVKGALPGERVRARIIGKKKKHIIAETVEVLESSEQRVPAPCSHFGICGGCSWQHLAYPHQAEWKRQHVVDSFERLARIPVGIINETLASPASFGYRNKMEFSFGGSAWLTREEIDTGQQFIRDFALGLHVPGRFDKVRNITSCMLQSEAAARVLEHTHRCRTENPVSAYHQRDHHGFLRHLVIRTSASGGQVMTVLITTTPETEQEKDFVEMWLAVHGQLPDGSTVIHAINDTWSPVAVGTITSTLGPGYLEEVSDGIHYRISPFSFFQTNTIQLPNLVSKAMEGAGITSECVVWDLYCGTGTLTLPAAKRAKHVVGAELVESSIADAKSNAVRNGIDNVEFHVVDLHHASALQRLGQFMTPDVIMVDPPRNGMHEQVVRHLLAVAAPRIMYVSCNPATLARDCAMLHELYDVVEVTPVDMFPQTYHVEAVAVLQKRP
jgi:23S rRNA (uracil1939-C5)-methyltransferase